jgi:hypothetical protein
MRLATCRLQLVLVLLLLPTASLGNDAAAETAAGGIRLREERRVAMKKERLTIAKINAERTGQGGLGDRYHVTVEYEFQADKGPDVQTEVAFPLPEYSYGFLDLAGTRRVSNFGVEVDGKPVQVGREVRAYVGEREVTLALNDAKLDIETFGGFSGDSKSANYQVVNLPAGTRHALTSLGALNPSDAGEPFALGPAWSVVVTYHWRQLFPSGKVVRVRHEYDAIAGLAYAPRADALPAEAMGPPGCFDAPLVKALESLQRKKAAEKRRPMIFYHWVRYVLSTANTWKTPISDFELLIDHPPGEFVSLCWDGPIGRVSKTRFRAAKKDFVPGEDLTVYFLDVSVP